MCLRDNLSAREGRDAYTLHWVIDSINQQRGLLRQAQAAGMDAGEAAEAFERLDQQRAMVIGYQNQKGIRRLRRLRTTKEIAKAFGLKW